MDKKQNIKNQKISRSKKTLKYVVSGIFLTTIGAGVAAGLAVGLSPKDINKKPSDSSNNQQYINAIDLKNSNYNSDYYIGSNKQSPVLTAYFNFSNINKKDVNYKWYACDANGDNPQLVKSLNSSSFIPTIKTDTVGTYYFYCVASYQKISAKSKVFVVNVLDLPNITISASGSVNATLNETSYQSINPTINNLASYSASYQWYSTNPSYDTKDAVSIIYKDVTYYEIPKATSLNYTLNSSDVSSSGTFSYIVKANVKLTSDYSYDYYSNVVSVSVQAINKPTITLNQSTYSVVKNQSENLPSFTPIVSGGNNLTYQWYTTNPYFKNDSVVEINGVDYYTIPNATNNTYSVTTKEDTTTGSYSYVLGVVSNLNGASITAYSEPYTLMINSISSITISKINDASAYQNQTNSVTFSANVSIPSTYSSVSYTWYQIENNKDVVVSTGSNSFTISSFPTTGTFSYYLQITASIDGVNTTTKSSTFTLTVNSVVSSVTFSGNNTLTVYKGQSSLPQLAYTIDGLSNDSINTCQWYTTNSYYKTNNSVDYNGTTYYAISNATDRTLNLNSASFSSDGTYEYILVITSDFNGNTQTYNSSSEPFTIDVKTLTSDSIVFANTNYNLNVTLNNLTSTDVLNVYATVNNSSNYLTYQWYDAVNNTAISGATSSSFSITNELLKSFNNQSFSVYCVVSYSNNGLSFSANSSTYNVIVSSVPTVSFSNNTQNISAIVGETSYQTIYANALSSNDALTVYYEWYSADSSFVTTGNAFNTTSSYTLTKDDVKTAQTLYYVVKAYVVLNGVKYYANSNLDVTVNVQVASNDSITINNPSNTSFNTYVSSTNNINLSITATANNVSDLTYQWYSNTTNNDTTGSLISNTNSSLYQFNASKITSSETLYYYCVVSGNVNGVAISKTSAVFTVYINAKPTITFNSSINYKENVTTGTHPITLYTSATLSGFTNISTPDTSLNNVIITYTWYDANGNELGNGTSYTLTTNEMNSTSDLTFYVVASASFNGITVSEKSSNYVISFNALPTLNNVTISSNYSTVFSTQANSINLTSNFTSLNNTNVVYSYQWYSSSTSTAPTLSTLDTYTKITNATNSTYTFSDLATTTYYFVVVSASLNGASLTPVISNMLQIDVLAKPTITFNSNIDYDITTTKNATDLPTLYTGASLSDFVNNEITYAWYGNTTNSTTGGVALNESGTSLNLTSTLLNKYSYFYVVATSIVNGSTITNTSQIYTITTNNAATITFNNNIDYDSTGYENQTNSIILQTNATSSNNAAITYTWYDASTNGEVGTGASFTFNDFTKTGTFTYYVIASIVENGTTIKQQSKTYTITINALPTITLSSNYTNNTVDATLNETTYQTLVVNASISDNFNLTYSWSSDVNNISNTYQLTSNDVNALGSKAITCTVSSNINGYTLTKTITFTINVSDNANVVWSTLTNYSYSTITQATTPINLSVSANSSVGNYTISYNWYESSNDNATLENLSSLTDLNNNTANYSFSASKITTSQTLYLYVVASFKENGVVIQSLSTPFTITIKQAPSIIWNNSTYSAYNNQTNSLTISAVASLSDGFTNSITYTWPDNSTGSTYTVNASSFDTSKSSITIPVTAISVVDGYTITSTSSITINLTTLPTLTLSTSSGSVVNATQNETTFQTIYSNASFSTSDNYGINYAWFTNANDVNNLSDAINNAINTTSSFKLSSDYVKTDNTIYEVAYSIINGKTVYSNVLTYNIKVSTLPQVTFDSTTTNYNLIVKQTTIPTLNAVATAENENVNYAWFELSSNTIPSDLQAYLTSHTSLSASNNYTPSFTATNSAYYYLCIAYVLNNGVYTLNSLLFTYNVINDITITQTNKHFDYNTTIQATNPLVLNATFSINNLPSNITNWNIGQITYQWYTTNYENTSGTAITDETNASYSFSAAVIMSATTKYFYVVASVVINGVTISSTTITTYNINITDAPTINWTSGLTLSYNVLSGTNLTLNASATTSDSSYTIYYLWNNADESTTSSITLKDLTTSQTISVNAWITVNGTKYSVSKPLTYTINVLNNPDAYFTYNTTTQTKTIYNDETGDTIFSSPSINVVSNSSNYDVSNASVYYEWYNSSDPNTIIGNSASLTIANSNITSTQTYYVKAYYLIDGIKCYIKQNETSSILQSTNYTINYSTLSKIAFNNQTSYTWYTSNTLPSVSVNVINNTNNLSIQYVWTYNNQTLNNNDSATLSSDNLNKILDGKNGTYIISVTANLMLNNVIAQTITETITLNYLANPTLSFNNTSLNNALILSNTINSKNPIVLNGSVSVSGDTNAIVSLVYSWYDSTNKLISNDSSYSFSANSSVGDNTYTLKVEAVYNGNVVATLTSGLITIKTVANPTITLTTINNTTITYLNGYKISQILSVNSTLSDVSYVWTWNGSEISNNVANLDLSTLTDFKTANTLSVYAALNVNGNTITSNTITFTINTLSINTNDFTFNSINNNVSYTSTLPTLTNSATFTQSDVSSYASISYNWYSNSTLTDSLNNNTNSYILTSNVDYGKAISYYETATLSINGIIVKTITQIFNVSRLVLPTITINSLSSNQSIYANSSEQGVLNVNASLNNALNWNNVSLTYTWYDASTNKEVGTGATFDVSPTTTTSYYVKITGTADNNALSEVTSNNITITVLSQPTLTLSTNQTSTINYYQNQTSPITLDTSLSTNSSFKVTYVWSLNGTTFSNDTSSYTISNFSKSSYTYTVYAEITDSIFTSTIKSNIITFTLSAKALPTNSVVANQTTYTVYNDQSISYNPTLSITLANSIDGNVTYNWYASETIPTNLKDANNSIGSGITYTNSSKYTTTMYYYAIATVNYDGVVATYYMTNYITVDVIIPTLSINTLQTTYDLISGISNSPTLSVSLTNPQNINSISYVWTNDNEKLTNTSSSYTLTSIPSTNTTYTVYATGSINGVVVKSKPITFTINVSQPSIKNTNFGITLTGNSTFSASNSYNENVTLNVNATSNITNATYTYTWYEDGNEIANSNTSSLPFSIYGKYLTADVSVSFSVVVTLTIDNTTLTLNSLKNSNSFANYNVYLYQDATISGNYYTTLPTSSTSLTLYQNQDYTLAPNISVISNGNLYSYQWVITNLTNNDVTYGTLTSTYNPIDTSEIVNTSDTGNYEYYLKITLNGTTYYSDVYKITINTNTYTSAISYNGTSLVTDVHLASGMDGKFNLSSILNSNNVYATYTVVFGVLNDSSTNKTITVNSDGILDLGTLTDGSYNLDITSTYTSYQTFTTSFTLQIYVSSIQTLAGNFGWNISVSQNQTASYIYANQTADLPTFSISASAGNSGVAFSYEWLQNSTKLDDTSSSFDLLNTSGVTSATTWTCNVYVIYMGTPCLWSTQTFSLKVYSTSDITLSSNTLSYTTIVGQNITLSQTALLGGNNDDFTYDWDNSASSTTSNNGSSYTFDATNSGSYSIILLITLGNLTKTVVYTITVLPTPNITYTQTNGTIYVVSSQKSNSLVFGVAYSFNPDSSYYTNNLDVSYSWKNSSGTVVSTTESYTPSTTAGTYTLTIKFTLNNKTIITRTLDYSVVLYTPTITLNSGQTQYNIDTSYGNLVLAPQLTISNLPSDIVSSVSYTWALKNKTISSNDSYTFNNSTPGTYVYTYTYTYLLNGVKFSNSAIYTINVSVATKDAYSLNLSNLINNTLTTLQYGPSSVISTASVSLNNDAMSVVSYSYDWLINNKSIYTSSNTTSSLNTNLISKYSAGTYSVVLNAILTLINGSTINLTNSCSLTITAYDLSISANGNTTIDAYNDQTTSITLNPIISTNNSLVSLSYSWNGVDSDSATYTINKPSTSTTTYTLTVTAKYNNETVATKTITYTLNFISLPTVSITNSTPNEIYYINANTSTFPILTPNVSVSGDTSDFSFNYIWSYNTTNSKKNWTLISSSDSQSYTLSKTDISHGVGTYYYWLSILVENINGNGVSFVSVLTVPYEVIVSSSLEITSQPATNTTNNQTTFSVGQNYTINASASFKTSNNQDISYYWEELDVNPNASLGSNSQSDYNTWTPIPGQNGTAINTVTATLSMGSTISTTPTQEFRCVFYQTNDPSNSVTSNTITITTTYNSSEQTQNLESLLNNPYWDMGLLYAYGGTSLLNLLYSQTSGAYNIFGLNIENNDGSAYTLSNWTGYISSISYVPEGSYQFSDSKYPVYWNTFLVNIITTNSIYIQAYNNSGYNWSGKYASIPAGTEVSMYLPFNFFSSSISSTVADRTMTSTRTITIASDGQSTVTFTGQVTGTESHLFWNTFTFMFTNSTTNIAIPDGLFANGTDIINGSILLFQNVAHFGYGSGYVFTTSDTNGYLPDYSKYTTS